MGLSSISGLEGEGCTLQAGLGELKGGRREFLQRFLNKVAMILGSRVKPPLSSVLALPCVNNVRKLTNYSECHCLELKNGIRIVLTPTVLRI